MNRPEPHQTSPVQRGDLVLLPNGRQGRFVMDCGSFVVCTQGDPDRGHQTLFPLVALTWEQLRPAAEAQSV